LGPILGPKGPPVLASQSSISQSSTFFSANKNAESHVARVLSACDAGVEARFFNATRWFQMSGKVPRPSQTFDPPHACRGAAVAETVFDFF
jgi:hypothetical protein